MVKAVNGILPRFLAVHRGLKAQLSRTNQLITFKRLKFILIGGTDFKISNPKIFKIFWIKNEMMEDHKRLWNLIQLESLNEVLNEKNKYLSLKAP